MDWQFWIDRGGTFTDVVARDPDGRIVTAKLLSEDPGRYADAAVEAIRRLSGGVPRAEVRIGTTSRPMRCWSAPASRCCSR